MHGIGAVQVRPQLHVRPGTEVGNVRQKLSGVENLDIVDVKQHLLDNIDGLGDVGRACDVRQDTSASHR